MSSVWFSAHALYQLGERGLSQRAVEQAVRKPLRRFQQSTRRYRAVQYVRKRSKRYLLVVIYDDTGTVREVVTAFLTSKVKKYLP